MEAKDKLYLMQFMLKKILRFGQTNAAFLCLVKTDECVVAIALIYLKSF